MIDLNGFVQGSIYFKWKEILWLNSWGVYIFPTEEQYNSLLKFILKIDTVRQFVDLPFFITSGIRPQEYNKQIKGSRFSMHCRGRAIDFQVKGYETKDRCKLIRSKIVPMLDEFKLRCEDVEGDWIHLDDAEPGKTGRFFKP